MAYNDEEADSLAFEAQVIGSGKQTKPQRGDSLFKACYGKRQKKAKSSSVLIKPWQYFIWFCRHRLAMNLRVLV